MGLTDPIRTYIIPTTAIRSPTHNPNPSMKSRKPDPVKRCIVMVRLDTTERDELARAADRAGVPLSTWLRTEGVASARRLNARAA